VFYDFSFTIPANTPQNSPAELRCKLTQGITHRVEISFPPGCAGLVYLQIFDNAHQVYPTNPGGSFKTDSYTIAFNDYYELKSEPYTLRLVGWNEDDTYDHTLEVRFGILEEKYIKPYEEEMGIIRRLKRLFFRD